MAPHDAFSLQIYGKESQFDAARLIDLLGAYESFKVASTSARGSMDAIDVTDTGSSTALPQGTAPGRYEPGSALQQVRTASPGVSKADFADLALMALIGVRQFLKGGDITSAACIRTVSQNPMHCFSGACDCAAWPK